MLKLHKTAITIGNNTDLKISTCAPLIFINLDTFKKQVKKFEKYIIIINPLSPLFGSINNINTIRINESEIAVQNVKFCWSKPFSIPSQILSKYISGTIGDR